MATREEKTAEAVETLEKAWTAIRIVEGMIRKAARLLEAAIGEGEEGDPEDIALF